jgi:hypothetical protein
MLGLLLVLMWAAFTFTSAAASAQTTTMDSTTTTTSEPSLTCSGLEVSTSSDFVESCPATRADVRAVNTTVMGLGCVALFSVGCLLGLGMWRRD